jgi:hypothetical protein
MARRKKTSTRRRPARKLTSMRSTTKRRRNPAHPKRRTAMAATKRRRNPAPKRRRNPAPRRRRNPSYDYKAALIESVGFVGGAFVSGWINGAMNDIFAKEGVADDKAAKTLGIIKIVGSLGIFALGQYVKQNPSMLGGYAQQYQQYAGAIENFTVAGSAVALADGIDLLTKEDRRSAAIGGALASNKGTAGTRRRRSMRGVIVQSPTLQQQLSTSGMAGTAMLPMNGMQGSLEMFGAPQPSLVAMQASAAPRRSYYGGGPMGASAYGSCI